MRSVCTARQTFHNLGRRQLDLHSGRQLSVLPATADLRVNCQMGDPYPIVQHAVALQGAGQGHCARLRE